MADRSIVYLMSGPGHLPYLIVSLYTLRRYWNGPVVVHAWPESIEIVQHIAQDKRLGITAADRGEPDRRGKNGQFIDKIRLLSSGPPATLVYLDADTIITGTLAPLIAATETHGFAATQFCTWVTTGGIIRTRVERLRDCDAIPAYLIDAITTKPYPSPNGGIIGCRSDSTVFDDWHRWTLLADDMGVFIADECVLQLMPVYQPMTVLTGGLFNCSVREKYTTDIERADVRVWHGHGDCFARPDKAPWGHRWWMALYRECIERNLGGVAEWRGKCEREYKWFRRLNA